MRPCSIAVDPHSGRSAILASSLVKAESNSRALLIPLYSRGPSACSRGPSERSVNFPRRKKLCFLRLPGISAVRGVFEGPCARSVALLSSVLLLRGVAGAVCGAVKMPLLSSLLLLRGVAGAVRGVSCVVMKASKLKKLKLVPDFDSRGVVAIV